MAVILQGNLPDNAAHAIWFSRISPNWGRVEHAALRPQAAQSAREIGPAVAAEIAVIDFAVIADRFDDGGCPAGTESGDTCGRRGEKEFHVFVLAFAHNLEVCCIDAELLGIDQSEDRPAHRVEELLVTLSQKRRQR